MSEQDWTVKDVPPQPSEHDREHSTTVEGLEVTLKERYAPYAPGAGLATPWTVRGFLADLRVSCCPAINSGGYDQTVEQAKDRAIAAAQRLYAAGVRGEISYPVSCCDRLLPTREDAERHQVEHVAEPAMRWIVEKVRAAVGIWPSIWAVIDTNGEIQSAYHDDEEAARERAAHLNADEEAMPEQLHYVVEGGENGRWNITRISGEVREVIETGWLSPDAAQARALELAFPGPEEVDSEHEAHVAEYVRRERLANEDAEEEGQ